MPQPFPPASASTGVAIASAEMEFALVVNEPCQENSTRFFYYEDTRPAGWRDGKSLFREIPVDTAPPPPPQSRAGEHTS